jgi:hypothetical protein
METARLQISGLVAHWRFDAESGAMAGDSVGDCDGVVHGAAWCEGIIGEALYCDGIDDYVACEFNLPEALTLSL